MPERTTITAVDLFCGAGGFSEGLSQAADELGFELREAAVNHWDRAVETHEANHPDAHQYHSKVEQLHPPDVVERLGDGEEMPDVDLLVGGPSCTHFSRARAGKPVSEQKRMSPWHVLEWLELLNVDAFIIENVPEIQSWGPVVDGQPTRDGSIFDAWVNALNTLGYAVDWTELVAADYGDPTTRQRFFIVGRQHGGATFPEPTHSDDDPELPDWRTAGEVIDWSDLGGSIWTRDLTNNRVHTPPKDTTMQRIAEGLRKHCADVIDPFADVIEQLGQDEIRALREQHVVPAAYADQVAATVDEPFLVDLPAGGHALSTTQLLRQQDGGNPWAVRDAPVPTIPGKGAHAIATTQLLRQQDGDWATAETVGNSPVPTIATRGGHSLATTELRSLVKPRNGPNGDQHSNKLYPPDERPSHVVTAKNHDGHLVTPSLIRYSHGGAALGVDDPMPTIATEKGGVFALSSPYLTPLYSESGHKAPRTRSIDRPLMTVTAQKPSPAMLTSPVVKPFIDDYEGAPKELSEPLGTVTSRDRFALCVPELWPWGLDIRYRMLQPHELKQAQGFPADYDLSGTKTDRTEQIGNAVPVSLATELCEHVLTAQDPSLAGHDGGFEPEESAEIPDYSDILAAATGGQQPAHDQSTFEEVPTDD